MELRTPAFILRNQTGRQQDLHTLSGYQTACCCFFFRVRHDWCPLLQGAARESRGRSEGLRCKGYR